MSGPAASGAGRWRAVLAATLALGGLCAQASIARADSILGLYGTGVGSDGIILPDGSAEQHYALVSQPSGSTCTLSVIGTKHGFPRPPWKLIVSTQFSWIAPCAGQTVAAGQYDYRMTFDLTGFDPSTANIQGRWATDNSGFIYLNGAKVTGYHSVSFMVLPRFAITKGFVSGVNMIDFIVTNNPDVTNPSGLAVEISGTASPTQR